MKKIIIKLILVIIMLVSIFRFFNKYDLVFNSDHKLNYSNYLIGVSNDKKISYEVYLGSTTTSSYQNKYFIEYDMELKNLANYITVKKKSTYDGNLLIGDILDEKSLNVRIKDYSGNIVYETGNLLSNKLVKQILKNNKGKDKNIYFRTNMMYLSENNKGELILNIPFDNSSLSSRNELQYNLKTKEMKKSTNDIEYKLEEINSDDDVLNELVMKSKFTVSNKNNINSEINKGYKTYIINNGSDYYETFPNSQLFKQFPELKKYLNKHSKKDQLIINFDDDFKDEEIIDYLK